MPLEPMSALQARAILAAADLRGLRRRAGISAATIAAAFGVPVGEVYSWERRDHFPGTLRVLTAYARVIAGLARHEQIPSGDEGKAADAA